jgi:Tfp pilus assembly protein PilF
MIRIALLVLVSLVMMVGAVPATAAPAAQGTLPAQHAAESASSKVIATARALVNKGATDSAELLLRQALELAPDPERIYYELGCIYEQRGEHAKALAAFKEGVRIHEQGRRRQL